MGHSVVNLTFHGIGEPPHPIDEHERAVWLDEAAFGRALDAVEGRDRVTLSFDDGNRSDVVIALPALLERGLRARFFVVAGRIGERGFLDLRDIDELVASGMEVASHGLRHRSWRGLDEEALDEELAGARRMIEAATGRPVESAACPFGAYDRRVLDGLRRAGFRRVFTSDGGQADPAAWLQPRTTLGPHTDAKATVDSLLRGPRAGARGARTVKLAVKRWR